MVPVDNEPPRMSCATELLLTQCDVCVEHELRFDNFSLMHDDPLEFIKSQWPINHKVYIAYRLVVSIGFLAWLAADAIYETNVFFKEKPWSYLIYATNWSFLLLASTAMFMAICTLYYSVRSGESLGIYPIPKLRDFSLRLEKLKLAVLTLMNMNSTLYRHLYSNGFDLPEYEKVNILHNSRLLDEQFQAYFTEHFYNPDFKYHQRQLDRQILCNRRLRQTIREARETYADIPWYSRKTFKTKEVFPDAVKLPKTLPMTYLCDHLLKVYHYMHDPQVAAVMNALVADGNKSSVTTEKKTQLVVLSQAAKIQSHCTTSKNIIKHAKKVTEPTNFKATAGTTQNEMNAKVRRIVQWLCEYAIQIEKKESTSTKRKASMMETSHKDHDIKRQKTTEAKPIVGESSKNSIN